MFSSNASQVSSSANYIEDFFSAWLRTGTGSSQTVTTGIEEDTGALVISKSRSAATDWAWYDTFRGATKDLVSNSAAAQTTQSQGLTSFNSNGHTWGTLAKVNTSGATYVDFVLKPQPKFFDVVTYTGNGAPAGQVINHNLGSIPGFIICKCTSTTQDWAVCARTGGAASPASAITYATGLSLNTTAAAGYTGTLGDFPTATTFNTAGLLTSAGAYPNLSGQTYVAYLFAHNAGGFGLSGTDNVISCGSWAGNGSTQDISLGYEPQWILLKNITRGYNWVMSDVMRSMDNTNSNWVYANTAAAEETNTPSYLIPTATGFKVNTATPTYNASGDTYIYIAIRRGPMKVPTDGTSVFSPNTIATAPATFNIGFPLDLIVNQPRNGAQALWGTRLQGPKQYLDSSSTAAEVTAGTAPWAFDKQNDSYANYAGTSVAWNFRRAPGFFDVVCYTGTGVAGTFNHNLAAVPELMILKGRSAVKNWVVYPNSPTQYLYLNAADPSNAAGDPWWNSTAPTSSVFSLGTGFQGNASGTTYVAYLFATCAGVSKVGTYTGTGTTQAIACGFTTGARFVMIKRMDDSGDWYVWDSARGIVAGNDSYLLLNSTAAEVTNTDYVDTYSAGFEISSTAPAAINASGGSFIFLAVA